MTALPTLTLTFTASPGFGGTSCAACQMAVGVVRCSATLSPLTPITFYLCDDCAEARIA